MTRLTTNDIKDLYTSLQEWKVTLEKQTGLSLLNIAALAGDVSRGRVKSASWRLKVGVVPVTSGLGVIDTFAQNVAAIVELMQFEAFVTEQTDVAGIYEAYQREASIVFLADDNYFLAINTAKKQIVENSDATARGFVAALDGAAGGLRDRQVLVLGGGRVGQAALNCLKTHGAISVLYDTNKQVMADYAAAGGSILRSIKNMKDYELIVDTTPVGNWITADMLHPKVIFSAPGVPLSLNEEATASLQERLIHDLLPTGVITMLAMAC